MSHAFKPTKAVKKEGDAIYKKQKEENTRYRSEIKKDLLSPLRKLLEKLTDVKEQVIFTMNKMPSLTTVMAKKQEDIRERLEEGTPEKPSSRGRK